MIMSLRSVDLLKLNALTKYPSILTYHPLDPKQSRSHGKHEEAKPLVRFSGSVLVTEKIDGVNARIVVLPDESYLIGSREEFLYARGDLLHNSAMSIVDTVRPMAEQIAAEVQDTSSVVVCYGEVYGGKVTDGSRQYTGEQRLGFRLFDVAVMADADATMKWPVEQISAWREGEGQTYLAEPAFQSMAQSCGVLVTPRLTEVEAEDLPQTIEEALEFLEQQLPESRAALDSKAAKRAEGVVLRHPDRSAITKLRFKDYQELCKEKRER